MRKRDIFVFYLVGILGVSACSSSSVETSKKVTATSDSNSTSTNTVAVNTGTQVGMPQVADANTTPAATTDELALASNRMDQRLNEMRKAGETGPQMGAEQIAQKNARPAPDNSTFTSYLTDAGYEIRTFTGHPQLLKVEKKIAPDGKQSIKVFLRDGRVIDLPGQRIAVLASATAAYILEAAGVQAAPAQTAPPAGPPATKKSGE